MKNKIVLGALLAVSMFSYAQKDEIKAAEKSFKKGDFTETLSNLEKAEGSIASADDKLKDKFYYLKGAAYVNMALAQKDVYANLEKGLKSFEQLETLDKSKYTSDVAALKAQATDFVLKEAQSKYELKEYKDAYKGFEEVYRLSPKDTVMLYNAAVVAWQGQLVDETIALYEELKDLNYDGTTVDYFAVDDKGEKKSFGADKNQRDLMVKMGTYKNPEDITNPSKRSDVVKNLALLYMQQGNNDKALEAFADARAENPNDVNLVMGEGSVYYQMGNKQKFKELMQEAAKMKPEDATIPFNIGVINLEQGLYDDARAYFKQALTIKPDYEDAVLNLSVTYVNEGNALVEQMNALGNSREDVKKYNELGEQKEEYFSKAAQVLEEYVKANPNSTKALTQLKNIYGALGDTENFQRVKGLLGE